MSWPKYNSLRKLYDNQGTLFTHSSQQNFSKRNSNCKDMRLLGLTQVAVLFKSFHKIKKLLEAPTPKEKLKRETRKVQRKQISRVIRCLKHSLTNDNSSILRKPKCPLLPGSVNPLVIPKHVNLPYTYLRKKKEQKTIRQMKEVQTSMTTFTRRNIHLDLDGGTSSSRR